MTLMLTADIDELADWLEVTGTVPDEIEPGYLFTLCDGTSEVMRLDGFAQVVTSRTWPGFPPPQSLNRNRWHIGRGWIVTTEREHVAYGSIHTTPTAHENGSHIHAVVRRRIASTDEIPPYPVRRP